MTICVVGCANRDIVLGVGTLPRAGETVVATARTVGVGGKGVNQAIAAALAGAVTTFVGVVGDDAQEIAAALQSAGVDADLEHRVGASSSATVVVDAQGENLIVVAAGATEGWRPSPAQVADADLVVLQLELGLEVALLAARAARDAGHRVVLNASPVLEGSDELAGLVDVLVVNEHEAAALSSAAGLAPTVVTTLGARGCRVVDAGVETVIPGIPAEVVDTTGAGDTFCGYLVAGLDEGLAVVDAARLATAAASLSVGRAGAAASIPRRAEVVAT